MTDPVPAIRVRALNDRPIVAAGRYVLYWMVAQRRVRDNFALQHAADWARHLGKPLLVFEALRLDHPWANDRLHRFVLEGMAVNARRLAAAKIGYFPYLEPTVGAGKGLLAALAADACLVVSDEYPCYFIPRMLAAAASELPVRLEAVDGNGVIPLRASPGAFPSAHGFRRWLQKQGAVHLLAQPLADPLAELGATRPARLPAGVGERWPKLGAKILEGDLDAVVAGLAIDHGVAPAPLIGGSEVGEARLREFLATRLDRYADGRGSLDRDASSGLSPWLHFGHVGAWTVARAVLEREDWSPDRLGDARVTRGSREGWWGLSPGAEAFLDQLVVWRELGQHFCWHEPEGTMRPDALPDWARRTLAEHADDPRPSLYSLAELEQARTHDPVWNHAQGQLLREGRIHNYLRMLWGKKILEWSPSAAQAIARMIHLNDKYALDGRDPNSYSGIFWVCGRFDRAWGPERPIFGKIRYMSSDNTRKKLGMKV